MWGKFGEYDRNLWVLSSQIPTEEPLLDTFGDKVEDTIEVLWYFMEASERHCKEGSVVGVCESQYVHKEVNIPALDDGLVFPKKVGDSAYEVVKFPSSHVGLG